MIWTEDGVDDFFTTANMWSTSVGLVGLSQLAISGANGSVLWERREVSPVKNH
jgi:hypothetical protein